MANNNKAGMVAASVAATTPHKNLANLEQKKKLIAKQYNEQEKVPVTLAPQYQGYFGRFMLVSINCISISVPVDGSTVYVPETFAAEINRRRRTIDSILLKQQKMSNISENMESYTGELELF